MSADREASSAHAHRESAPKTIPCVVITVSDSRSLETDSGGALMAELVSAQGHPVVKRLVVRDELSAIQGAVRGALADSEVAAVLVTGGTGIAARDVTPEALRPLLDRELPGFGELFRMLSYQEIGSAALLSRALAGTAGGRLLVALPGSRAAIRLGLEKLLLPELGHLLGEAQKGRTAGS